MMTDWMDILRQMALLLGFVDSSGQTRTSTPGPTPESARETSLGNKVRPRTHELDGAREAATMNHSARTDGHASFWVDWETFLFAPIPMHEQR